MPLGRSLAALALLALIASVPARAGDVAGDFDFYVLSLSWSPSYCRNADRPDPAQCDLHPTGFVVHGLWPQYENGYPEYCDSIYPRNVQRSVLTSVDDLMPGDGLVQHEWQKHGTCAGLRQEKYFSLLRDAVAAVVIPKDLVAPRAQVSIAPAALEDAFVAANPGLQQRGMAVSCPRDGTVEVRICLTKDLRFRRCSQVDLDTCRRSTIALPAEE